MRLVIENKIADSYPDLRIGIVTAKNINNVGKDEKLEELKEDKTRELRRKYTLEALKENPYITAWRETYRSFGVKPKKSTPTAEALLRRLLKGHDIPAISKAVDAYLAVETEFFLPIGGYDLDKISGDIVLRYSEGDERFSPLYSDKEELTKAGEIVYADGKNILTRKWNYKDSDHTKITEDSSNIILFSEAALAAIATDHLSQSMVKLQEYLDDFCGGNNKTMLVDIKNYPERPIVIDLPM